VASCGAFHETGNCIKPTSTTLNTGTIKVDYIVVISIDIRSRAVYNRRVHTGCCEGITIVASIGIGGRVTIIAACLAICCTADHIIEVTARITDTSSIFDCLCSIGTTSALGGTRACAAAAITVAAEHCEKGTLDAPVVVES
jgi:hypothetical protein